MEVRVWHKINYMAEAIALLERCADSGNDVSEQLRGQLSDKVIRRIEISERILKTGEAMMTPEMEKIQFYFKTLPNLSFTLADALLLRKYEIGTGKPENIADTVALEDEKEKLRRFIGLQMLDAVSEDENGVETAESWIDQLDTDDCTKWRLLSAYRHREKQLSDVIPLLESAQKVIAQTEDIWTPAVNEFVQFWGDMVRTRPVDEDLEKYSGVSLKTVIKNGEIVFCPSVMHYNAISFHILDETQPPENFCSVGIMFGEDFCFDASRDKNKEDDFLPEVLKLLGDKSKFKILKAVKNEGAYGARLAKRLELTTATISHHVNALVQKRLVLIEPEDNKVYFKLNKEKIREVIKALENEFL